MNFDLAKVSFSRYGSYMAIGHKTPRSGDIPDGLYLRSFHSGANPRESLRIELLKAGRSVPFDASAGPAVLRLGAQEGWAEFCFAETDVLRFRSQGVGVRLTSDTGWYRVAMPAPSGRWHVNAVSSRTQYMLTPLAGTLQARAPVLVERNAHTESFQGDFLPDAAGRAEGAVEEFVSAWTPRDHARGFQQCVAAVQAEFGRWLRTMPSIPARYAPAGELAMYINWCSVVAPAGLYRRPAMLMSKNWMGKLWSWDNCFNAWALCYGKPRLAWDQLMIFVDNQHAGGAFADSIEDGAAMWSYCKPPIHGWVLRRMMERTDFITPAKVRQIYEPLCRWTDWWLARDYDGDGLPQYHHGNDSGWDNATIFDAGHPIEGPDLSAFLVLQMDVLAELAGRLGKRGQARQWQVRADELLGRLIEHSWRSDRFVAPRSGDHHVVEDADCLLVHLPIVLGKRLPAAIRRKIVAALKQEGRFLTAHGLASESVRSVKYVADGYWRGPIWAPAMMIAIDGLAAAGEGRFAAELARRFCDMCAAGGFGENFDALTGEALRDTAYTWTASVFLILAHEYLK